MSLLLEIKSLAPTRKDLVQFGLLVGGVFAAIGGLLLYKGHAPGPWLLGIGAALMILGAVVPALLKPVYHGWMAMALAMGFVMTRVILTIVFFLILLPIGLFMRLLGKDLLDEKIDRDATTYWKRKEYAFSDSTRFEKYF